MKKLLAILLFVPTLAMGAEFPNTRRFQSTNSENLTAAALTSTQTATFNIPDSGFTKARVFVTYVYGAATAVIITPSCISPDGSVTAAIPVRDCATTGACAISSLTDVTTGTASWVRYFDYDVRLCSQLKMVVTTTGSPTSSDILSTKAFFSVGL